MGFFGSEDGSGGVAVEGGEGGGPGGVEGLGEEREGTSGLDLHEGKDGELLGGNGEILGDEFKIFVLGMVKRGKGARVVSGETSASEVVVDFGAHGLDCRICGRGRFAEGKDIGRLTAAEPIGAVGASLVEIVRLRLIKARAATPFGLTSARGEDVDNDAFEDEVFGGIDVDHAIAVEGGCGKEFYGIGGLGEGDGVGIVLAEPVEDGLGGGKGAKAFGRLVVDIGEGQSVTASEKGADILEVNGGPADGFEEFGNADAAIVVAVDEGEGFLVEEGAFNRTGESDPEFLI